MDIIKAEFVTSNTGVNKCPKPDRLYRAFECRKIFADQYAGE